MPSPEAKTVLNLKTDLVDLATHRKAQRTAAGDDPLTVYTAYAQDRAVYQGGRIMLTGEADYVRMRESRPNDLVNKFGLTYASGKPMLLHRRLADVFIDVTLDLHEENGLHTVAMDALRTFDSGLAMQRRRPDLVQSGLLATAGNSAHNRALAIDSKLFLKDADGLTEADEHGHLDDLDMEKSSRFYAGPMSEEARRNRLARLRAWQRVSVRRRLPMANLLAEFWDDRVPGSPADMWRVLACRALCVGVDANPKTSPVMAKLKSESELLHSHHRRGEMTAGYFLTAAQSITVAAWNEVLSGKDRQQLEKILGEGGGEPPAPEDYLFHEWIATIHDDDLEKTWGFRQAVS